MYNGLVLVNKPTDWTSFDVIAKLRGKFGTRKIGHTGTLDPLATGVLVLCVGKFTKLSDYFMHQNKTYIAELEFGKTSDTQDILGKVKNTNYNEQIAKEKIENVIKNFIGKIKQTPPMYSAIKINGQKLCDLARKGIEIEREQREVKILDIRIIKSTSNSAKIEVTCSSGTYIRTLIHDIGQELGCGAVMTSLCRTKNGEFDINDCIDIEDVDENSLRPIIFDTSLSLPFPTSLCIGKFDGVHNGHKEIIKQVTESAYVPTCLIIENDDSKILSEIKRQEKLHKLGIDAIIYQNLNEIKNIEYDVFFEEYLYNKLHCRELTVGFNFFFGKNRQGDITKLQELCKKFNVKLNIIDAVLFDKKPISSTFLKKLSNTDETFLENIVKNY